MDDLLKLILSYDVPVLGILIYIVFKMNSMSKDISHIQKDLGNHIGDTNKKIDRLSDRFDRLYEFLLKKTSK